MSIIDVLKTPELEEISTDICIAGAGAAGITLASELAISGREICLIESGGMGPDLSTQSLYDLENVGYPIRPNYMSRARYFGGSCNLWAGRSMALSRFDMAPRSWVANSGWPIPHAELERYYPRAGQILRLPDPRCLDAAHLRDAMSPTERLILDDGALAPTVSLWAKRPMRFGARYRSVISRAANLRLALNASVVSVDLGESGRSVESLTIATLAGRRLAVRARQYVLACGGLENARLLLVSRSRHAAGVGNGYGLVGRFYMDHPRAVYGVVDLSDARRLDLLRGLPLRDGKLQIGIGLSEETQRREGLLNHYATFESMVSDYTEARYRSLIDSMKILLRRGHAGNRWSVGRVDVSSAPNLIYLLSPKELVPHFLYRWYTLSRRVLPGGAGSNKFVVVYFCEQPPDPDSRVTLSHDTDLLGMQRIFLNWRVGGEIERTVKFLQQRISLVLAATGIGRLEAPRDAIEYTDASHHMGTTRMSDTPREGVVDINSKVHGVDNLYIAGSSVFPCAGHANPTVTIIALTLRLSDHLRSALG